MSDERDQGHRRERHFTLNLTTGEIRPAGVAEDEAGEERWVRLGEIDRDGRSDVDYSKASGWRPLSEVLWRWR